MAEDIRKPENVRYVLKGHLITDTALHVGSGYGSARTDATVVRDVWDTPYLPGSSFKGALRSAVERMIAGLPGSQLTTCRLTPGSANCLTTNTAWQEEYTERQESYEREEGGEKQLIEFLEGDQGLCDTCWLFGSPFSQSRLVVRDLTYNADTDDGAPSEEIRHGVGIDRDTLTAREQIKFDFEALPSKTQFDVELFVERPSKVDVGLLGLGLQEMQQGFVPLGGIRSRGLGRCHLKLTEGYRVRLDDKQDVLTFVRSGLTEEHTIDVELFMDRCLANLEQVL